MKKQICSKVMDFIDNFPSTPHPQWLTSHLTSCKKCRSYATISHNLQNLSLRSMSMPKGMPPLPQSTPHHLWRWTLSIASAIVAILVIWGGFSLFLSPKQPTTFSKTIQSSFVEDLQLIEDYTTIALLW